MPIAQYVALFRRSRWLLAIGAMLGLTVGALLALVTPPTYDATSEVFVSTSYAGSVTDLNQGTQLAQQVVATYADVATTDYVLEPVIRDLHLHTSVDRLAAHVVVAAPTSTSILQIRASANGAKASADLANAVAASLRDAIGSLSPVGSSKTEVRAVQIQRAVPPSAASSPKWLVNAAVGVILGLLLSLLIVVVRAIVDTRVRAGDELERLTSAPSIGAVPRDKVFARQSLVATQTDSTAEAVRALRTSLMFLGAPRDRASWVTTSAVEGEGKTTVVSNLAVALAATGARTVAVDADFRRPALAAALDLNPAPGLSEVLEGRAMLDEAIQSWGSDGLQVLTAGALPSQPQELLQSGAMKALMTELRDRYEYVLVDAPPLLAVSDAAIVGQLVDGCILVSKDGAVSETRLSAAVRLLETTRVPLVATVSTFVSGMGQGIYYAQER